jgi:hypothetical protein
MVQSMVQALPLMAQMQMQMQMQMAAGVLMQEEQQQHWHPPWQSRLPWMSAVASLLRMG